MANIEIKDLIKGLQDAREESVALVKSFSEGLEIIKEIAASLKGKQSSFNLGDAKDIEKINALLEESNLLAQQRTELTKNSTEERKKLQKIIREQIKLEKNLDKTRKDNLKTIKSEDKAEKDILKTKSQKEKAIQNEISNTEKLGSEKKKASKVTDEEIRQSIISRKERAQRRKEIEAEIILEQKSADTKRELQERIKALRIQGQSLDLGSEELARNNEEIDRLTAKLKDNSDQFVQNKINIGNYKSALDGLTNSFDDQKKRLNVLLNAYRELVAQGKEGTSEAKKLKKALDEQRESIKEVEEASKQAEKASEGFSDSLKNFSIGAGIGLIIGALTQLKDLFGGSREATLESQQAIANFTQTIKVFFASSVNAFDGVKQGFDALVNDLSKGWKSVAIGYQELVLIINKGINKFSDNNKAIKETEENIAKLNKEREELNKNNETYADGIKTIKDAFSGNVKVTKNAISEQQKFLKLQQDTEISILRQTRALAGLQERRQILQDISDDDTLGFITRAAAVQKAQKAAVDFARKEEELLLTRERLQIEAVKQDLRVSKIVSEERLKQITTGEQLNNLLKERGVALKVNAENEQAFTEAFTERIDKQAEREAFQRDQEEKNRKTARDDFEQRQDILEEFAEIQIDRNSKIVADETKTQEQRQKAIKDSERISRELLGKSTKNIIEQGKKSIDLNNQLTDSEKKLAKEKLDSLDIDKLVNEEDQQKVLNIIRALDLGEVEEKRLKESVKIRKDALEVIKEDNKVFEDSVKRKKELEADVKAQQAILNDETIKTAEDLNKALEKLDKEKTERRKKTLKEEIALLPEGSNERLEKEKELSDLLIEEKEKRLQKQEKLDDEAKKKREETEKFIRDQSFETFETIFKQRVKDSQDRQKDLNDEINQAKSRQSELLNLAASGNSETSRLAAESLAEQRRIERQRREELEEEKKKQIRSELILSGLGILRANADKPNGGVKTLAEVGAVIAGLTAAGRSFFVGADALDSNGKGLDSKGGMLNINHPGEMIIQKSLVDKMGKPSRFDVADVFTRYKDGDIVEKNSVPQDSNTVIINNNNEEILRTYKKLEKEIRNMSTVEVTKDIVKNYLEVRERKGNRVNKYIVKP